MEVIEEVEDAGIIEDVEVMPFEPQSQSTPLSHIRTSVSDPIKVDWIKHNIGPGRGSLGVNLRQKQGVHWENRGIAIWTWICAV